MHTLPSHATPTTSSAMCDRRGTSFASEVDAAIERVVAHFEDNDLALRLDVLRSLSAHAKLAFEAERIRERLRQHPATKELVDCVATQSKVFEQLTDSLRVDDCSCDYDAQRNVVMSTTTRWSLPSTGATKAGDRKKKRRKGESAASSAKLDAPLLVQYSFSRKLNEEGETELQLTVTARLGEDAAPSEMVHFAMTSASPYPRSFYEEVREFASDDEGEEGEEDASDVEVSSKPSKGGKPARKQSDASVKSTRSQKSAKSSKDEAVDEDDENDDEEGEEGESYGEAILAFRFDDKVLDEIMTWLKEHDTKYGDEIDHADVIGFFLAPPVHEDEWLLDERICEILFSSGAEFTDEEGGEEGSEVEGVGEGEEEEVDNE